MPPTRSSRWFTRSTTRATRNVALLEKCLSKFPAVAGVTLQDSADEGN